MSSVLAGCRSFLARQPLEWCARPLVTIIRHRRIIAQLIRRDLQGRYATSVMGVSWAFIQPLALLGLYTFVFSLVLGVRFGDSTHAFNAPFYLFCGMLPWLAFAEGLGRSTTVILEHVPLIKKVVFPSDILPTFVVGSALVAEAIGLALFLLAATLLRDPPGWTALALPLVLVPQILLTLGLGWLLASLNVFLRDVGQLVGLGLTLWMFVTPIFYPASLVPPRYEMILTLNPMRYVVEGYRALLLDGRWPSAPHLLILGAAAMATFLVGHWFFRRSQRAFVDVL
jgi:lipopolysaccharide transport system permease protein